MQNTAEFRDTLNMVSEIFRDVLENEDVVVGYETTASDIPEWDSLNHISLVISIEKKFGIRFSAREIQNFKNVGEMVEGIIAKTKA